jgi:hypothetical protein
MSGNTKEAGRTVTSRLIAILMTFRHGGIALVRESIPVWRRFLRMSLRSGRIGSPAWRCDLFR